MPRCRYFNSNGRGSSYSGCCSGAIALAYGADADDIIVAIEGTSLIASINDMFGLFKSFTKSCSTQLSIISAAHTHRHENRIGIVGRLVFGHFVRLSNIQSVMVFAANKQMI
jgi:hypothetical protein